MADALLGRRRFQLLTLWAGLAHQPALFAIRAVTSGGLAGANFPMTAAAVADYDGENNNAVNYGSVYAWKALGGSFAGGVAALIMTGTLTAVGSSTGPWASFGATLGALAAVVVYFKCKTPTREQWQQAVVKANSITTRREAETEAATA